MKLYQITVLSLSVLFSFLATATGVADVIPKPLSMKHGEGSFALKDVATISFPEELKNEGSYLIGELEAQYKIKATAAENSPIKLTLSKSGKVKQLRAEGYTLKVGTNGVEITASTSKGVFYGIQSLLQLIPVDAAKDGSRAIQSVFIEDKPRFAWRASHLDVSRHFYDAEFIKRYIDYLAMYKINVFHWHLTDHQGWRAEIKSYPKLTEVGAWRRIENINDYSSKVIKETPGQIRARLKKQGSLKVIDGKEYYGGFYTQEEMKDIVEYAKARHVEVVPEIDVPGHTQAVLAAYPEVGCSTMPKREVWVKFGLGDAILCVGKEETYKLVTSVFDEIAEIFPSKYVHIGADEAHPGIVKHWDKCEHCAKLRKDKKLKDGHAMQNYFVAWLKKELNKKDKVVIGWGEAFYNGMDKDMLIMSWWGTAAGEKAARHGNPVVMTPWSTSYFNMKVDPNEKGPGVRLSHLPVSMVYEYEPAPDRYSEQMRKNIIGYQPCLWTEFVPSTVDVDFLTFPRLAASAEVAWTQKDARNLKDFQQRLTPHYELLNRKGIHYFVDPPEDAKEVLFNDKVNTAFTCPFPEAAIFYREKGGAEYKPYEKPFSVEKSTSFELYSMSKHGIKSLAHTVKYTKIKADSANDTPKQKGLKYTKYQITKNAVTLKEAKQMSSGVADGLALPKEAKGDQFAIIYEGFIYFGEGDSYTFDFGKVDDVAKLSIANRELLNNRKQLKSGRIALKKGWYPIRVEFYEHGGAEKMEIQIKKSGEPMTDLQAIFAH